MQFTDEAIILNTKKLTERGLFASFFCRELGYKKSFCRYGQSKANKPVFQAGNLVYSVFSSRTNEQLGTVRCELLKCLSAKIMLNQTKLKLCNLFFEILNTVLVEHQNYESLYDKTLAFITDDEQDKLLIHVKYLELELELLQSLGFSYELSKCTVTGQTEDLIYIYPKTAKAVSANAGKEYKDILFKMPDLFLYDLKQHKPEDINNAHRINNHFLQKFVYNSLNKEAPAFFIVK